MPDPLEERDQITLMEIFASHAVIAIENVRQFRELQTRLAREAATGEILGVISRSRDDDLPVFETIVRNAQKLCDAPISALILIRPDDSHLTLVAHRNFPDAAVEMFRSRMMPLDGSHSYAARAILDRSVISLADMADSDLYRAGSPIVRTMVDDVGIRSVLFVPMMSRGVAIGTFALFRYQEYPFEDRLVALVETFAAQAVIAIENVRQFKALEALNAELGDRVQVQVGEIERMGRLKRFLPSAVADAVVSSGSEKLLSSHRALLGVLFCDIRGFTAFCETAEPEETIEVLQTYHEEMGALINAHKAGVDHRMGDGIMVLFNDPLPCDNPAGSAVRLAMAMRARMAELCVRWKRSGYRLGFGLGVSLGYATVGMVGAGGRHDYTASGTAINLASRLCDEALDGEILISPRAWTAIEDDFTAESRGEIAFKGIREPVEVFCVTGVVE
jgi:class 3 adenylate cyclase